MGAGCARPSFSLGPWASFPRQFQASRLVRAAITKTSEIAPVTLATICSCHCFTGGRLCIAMSAAWTGAIRVVGFFSLGTIR